MMLGGACNEDAKPIQFISSIMHDGSNECPNVFQSKDQRDSLISVYSTVSKVWDGIQSTYPLSKVPIIESMASFHDYLAFYIKSCTEP